MIFEVASQIAGVTTFFNKSPAKPICSYRYNGKSKKCVIPAIYIYFIYFFLFITDLREKKSKVEKNEIYRKRKNRRNL